MTLTVGTFPYLLWEAFVILPAMHTWLHQMMMITSGLSGPPADPVLTAFP